MAARNYATLTGPDIGVLAGYFVLVILIGLFVSSAFTVFVFGHLIFFFFATVQFQLLLRCASEITLFNSLLCKATENKTKAASKQR